MSPMKTLACNANFTLDGCVDLPARLVAGVLSTYWRPTDEEVMAIRAGLPVKISFLADRPAPMKVEVDAL